jgi:RNA-directed DNA polymerase
LSLVALSWAPPVIPIDDKTLFESLFAPLAMEEAFNARFSSTTSKGVDRLNGYQFKSRANAELHIASAKCLNGQYRFAPFLEVLKAKGRGKSPRLIGIPTIRDRIVLHQLNQFLAGMFPERVPKNVASSYVRQISTDLKTKIPADTWVCGTDIKTFYDSIQRDRLTGVLRKRVKCESAISLICHALSTPTVPRNTRRSRRSDYVSLVGVPQGLAISNILASIYMQDVDDAMGSSGVAYYRYVDDVLVYGDELAVRKAFRSLSARLSPRGLSLHPMGSGKTTIEPLTAEFGYLGYIFKWPMITVRDATIEKFLHSIASKFSDYTHNKARRLAKFNYLTPARVRDIFLLELNERITGAIRENKRYGWIAYFNQITDLTLLHRLDHAIAGLFNRISDFGHTPPPDLRKLSRSYFEMKFNPQGGYVRDYDKIKTRIEMLNFLTDRGRVDPLDSLTDEQIKDRYEKYVHHVIAAMHADEGGLYG